MAYVGFKDLVKRWPVYTARGLRKFVEREDFPAPFATINCGKTNVWYLADIVKVEATHPELTSEVAKRRKVAGYAAALSKKRKKN